MNRTVIFIAFVGLAATGLIGSVILLLFRPDASATFIAFVLQIMGLATVAATTFYGLGKVNEKVEVVQKQTNGTLSRLLEQREQDTTAIRVLSEEKAALEAALKHPSRKVKEL